MHHHDRNERGVYTPAATTPEAEALCWPRPASDHIGEVQAWNVDTGKRVWTHTYQDSQNWGPMVATGGWLVFSGGTNDRKFRAFDATSGALLWEFPTGAPASLRPAVNIYGGRQTVCRRAYNPAGASTPREWSSY